jgi:hypothetical protein
MNMNNNTTFSIVDRARIQQIYPEKGLMSCPVACYKGMTVEPSIEVGGVVFGFSNGKITDVSRVLKQLPTYNTYGAKESDKRIGLDTLKLKTPQPIPNELIAAFPAAYLDIQIDHVKGELDFYSQVVPINSLLGKALWVLVQAEVQPIFSKLSEHQRIDDFLDQQELYRILDSQILSADMKVRILEAFFKRGEFRKAVERLQPSCPLTGATDYREICFITPWRDANIEEKVDPNNALLIDSSLLDDVRLGIIHFEANGYIQVSSRVGMEPFCGSVFPAENDFPMFNFNNEQQKYLKRHKEEVFLGH